MRTTSNMQGCVRNRILSYYVVGEKHFVMNYARIHNTHKSNKKKSTQMAYYFRRDSEVCVTYCSDKQVEDPNIAFIA